MKGIILAAGKSTRLYPLTTAFSKHLLPVFDKPMIYYPLSILLLMGIKDILIIINPNELDIFRSILGDGNKFGVKISYEIQESPRGIADAFIIGEQFISGDRVCLILGDNVIYGQDLTKILNQAMSMEKAVIFAYPVNNPFDFGVVEFDDNYNVLSLEEKPSIPRSNYAIPGLYFYPPSVIEVAKSIRPSQRGEIEITSINNWYLNNCELSAVPMGRGIAWLDTGTPQALISASNFVQAVQNRQGLYIGCIEEIAWRRGLITTMDFKALAFELGHTEYGQYLMRLGDNK